MLSSLHLASLRTPPRSVCVARLVRAAGPLIVLLLPFAAAQATVHVRTGGADGQDGQTWATAKATVQAAVNAAASGDEVWVAEGTYMETITLPGGISLYGGFAGSETARDQRDWGTHKTILDGAGHGTVVTAHGLDIRVDGFTITRGATEPGGEGAGVYADGSVTLAHNEIVANAASPLTRGGGNGGGVCSYGTLTLISNVISRNSGADGGAVIGYGTMNMVGNTICNNESSGFPPVGSITAYGATTMVNNIIAFNNPAAFIATSDWQISRNDAFGNADVIYSGAVHSSDLPGKDNLSVDPLLVENPAPGPDGKWRTDDDQAGDLRLAANSPLINAGDDSVVQAGERDLGGLPRLQGAHVDIGAYEFPIPPPIFTMEDVTGSLRIAGGLAAAGEGAARLNIVDATTSGIDVHDAVAIARNASGLDANP